MNIGIVTLGCHLCDPWYATVDDASRGQLSIARKGRRRGSKVERSEQRSRRVDRCRKANLKNALGPSYL